MADEAIDITDDVQVEELPPTLRNPIFERPTLRQLPIPERTPPDAPRRPLPV